MNNTNSNKGADNKDMTAGNPGLLGEDTCSSSPAQFPGKRFSTNPFRPYLSLIIIIAGAALITSAIVRHLTGFQKHSGAIEITTGAVSSDSLFINRLGLSPEEAMWFRPLYSEYEYQRKALLHEKDSLMQIVKIKESRLSGQELLRVADRLVVIKSEEAALLSIMHIKLKKLLTPVKLIRVYLQIAASETGNYPGMPDTEKQKDKRIPPE